MSANGIADSGLSSKLNLFYESDESETPLFAPTTVSETPTPPVASSPGPSNQAKPVGTPKLVFTIRPSTPPVSTVVSAVPATSLSSLISISATNTSSRPESSISPAIGGTPKRSPFKDVFSVPEPTESPVETPVKRRPTLKMTTTVRKNDDPPTPKPFAPSVLASTRDDYDNSDDEAAATPKKRKRDAFDVPSCQPENPESSRIISELIERTLHLPLHEVKNVPDFPPDMLFSVLWYRLLFREVSEDERAHSIKFAPKGNPSLEPSSWEATIKQILHALGDSKDPSPLTAWRVERQLIKLMTDILNRLQAVSSKYIPESSSEPVKARVRPPCDLEWLAEALLPDVYAVRLCEYVVRWVKKNRKKNFTSAETIDQGDENAEVEAAVELVEEKEKPSPAEEELSLDEDENSISADAPESQSKSQQDTADSQYMNDDGEIEPETILTGAVEAFASVSLVENRIANDEDDSSVWKPSPALEARLQSLNPSCSAKQVEYDRLKRRHEMSLISDNLDEKGYAYFAKCARASFARQKKKLASFLAEKCGSRDLCVRLTPEVLECLGVLGSEFIANLVRRARAYPDKKPSESIGGRIFCCWIPRYQEGDLLTLNMNPAEVLR